MLDDAITPEFQPPSASAGWRNRLMTRSFVAEENEWRTPNNRGGIATGAGVQAARWCGCDRASQEFHADTPTNSYLVKVVLRNTKMRLAIDGRTIHDGPAVPGMFHVTEPSSRAAAIFRGSFDSLHLYVPQGSMDECARGLFHSGDLAPRASRAMTKDPLVESLARALLDAGTSREAFDLLYIEYISVALVARLLRVSASPASVERPRVMELARWRLKRAIDFIDASLEQSITLSDIAAVSGLSRMHFAAQFRAATGLRPHEYLLRRRIERAQEMLQANRESIVDIALSVGFQTQSHFTSIFKRFVGQTPQAWRRMHAAGCA